jgi:hypothetical protein
MLGPERPSLELSAGRKLVVQAGMSLEVVRDQRNTLGRQIGRGRHEASAICAQSPGHQTRVANLGEAHHGVEALLDHIDDPIAEIEIQYYLGIGPHERDESRHHQRADQWQGDTQCAARGLVVCDSSSSADSISEKMRRQRSRNRAPSAVSVMLRVLRWKRRTPSRSSIRATALPIAETTRQVAVPRP